MTKQIFKTFPLGTAHTENSRILKRKETHLELGETN